MRENDGGRRRAETRWCVCRTGDQRGPQHKFLPRNADPEMSTGIDACVHLSTKAVEWRFQM